MFLLFIISLLLTIFLVEKYNKAQEKLICRLNLEDSSQEYCLKDDNAFILHLNQWRYLRKKHYLKLQNEEINSFARKVDFLNIASLVSIIATLAFFVYLLF
jgi:hypothetical protein